mmetsp:Transcript_50601/g.130388  ORF Transcript_50601/g.130388 Transcript_50601/m.130388 type:complete len:210 (+) Transcript_50601:410-1039(+)
MCLPRHVWHRRRDGRARHDGHDPDRARAREAVRPGLGCLRHGLRHRLHGGPLHRGHRPPARLGLPGGGRLPRLRGAGREANLPRQADGLAAQAEQLLHRQRRGLDGVVRGAPAPARAARRPRLHLLRADRDDGGLVLGLHLRGDDAAAAQGSGGADPRRVLRRLHIGAPGPDAHHARGAALLHHARGRGADVARGLRLLRPGPPRPRRR